MNSLYAIGTTLGGALVGGAVGMWLGVREGGDFNLAPAIYAPVGLAIGTAVGAVVGALVFA